VITEPFVGLVEKFAVTQGMPGYHNVTLPHPVATRDDTEIRALVAGRVDEVVRQLTGELAIETIAHELSVR